MTVLVNKAVGEFLAKYVQNSDGSGEYNLDKQNGETWEDYCEYLDTLNRMEQLRPQKDPK